MCSVRQRISVLMPVRNASHTLSGALRSLWQQTHVDFEVLAVDDGSDDPQCIHLLDEQARHEKRLKVLSNVGRGIVAALQTGIAAASGDYIARMDADDICHPRRFQWQLEMALERKLDLVSCRVTHFGNFASSAGYAAYVAWTNRFLEAHELALAVFRESPLAHPSVLFTRQAYERLGGYRDGDFPEDYELWLRWFGQDVRAAKHPASLLAWRDHPGRLSRNDARYAPEAFARVKAQALFAYSARFNRVHPQVVILGAGRLARKKLPLLSEVGFELTGIYDIDARKVGKSIHGMKVMDRNALPRAGGRFCLSLVSGRGSDELIDAFLQRRGYCPGQDYLLVG